MMMGLGGLGLVFMLLFWAVLIGLALLAVGALFPVGSRMVASVDQARTARQIIDARYARGELTREQYELMKEDLS